MRNKSRSAALQNAQDARGVDASLGSEVMIIPNLITESLETGRNLSNSQVDFVVQTIRSVGTRSLIREFVVKCKQ